MINKYATFGFICAFYTMVNCSQSLAVPASVDCKDVLVANLSYDQMDSTYQLAWMSLITKDNFEEAKKSAGGNISYEGVSLGGTYDEFNQNRKKLFEEKRYSESSTQAISKIRVEVPEGAREDYVRCVESVAKANFGLFVWVSREDPYGADVKVEWHPTDGKPASISEQTLIGGKVPDLPTGNWLPRQLKLQPGGSTVALIQRDDGKQIRGSVKIGGLSEEFFVAEPSHPKYRILAKVGATATFVRNYTEVFPGIVHHTRCQDISYWVPQTPFCSSDIRRRPGSINSYSTLPLSNGQLPDFKCFQIANATLEPDPAPNCARVSVLYNECHFRMQGNFIEACGRGTGPGTPITVSINGTYEETQVLPDFTDDRQFNSSYHAVYPSGSLPPNTKSIVYSHSVIITDVVSGKFVLLDDRTLKNGPFSLTIGDGGQSVAITSDETIPLEEKAFWKAPLE
jgi:hypothetical protein